MTTLKAKSNAIKTLIKVGRMFSKWDDSFQADVFTIELVDPYTLNCTSFKMK